MPKYIIQSQRQYNGKRATIPTRLLPVVVADNVERDGSRHVVRTLPHILPAVKYDTIDAAREVARLLMDDVDIIMVEDHPTKVFRISESPVAVVDNSDRRKAYEEGRLDDLERLT